MRQLDYHKLKEGQYEYHRRERRKGVRVSNKQFSTTVYICMSIPLFTHDKQCLGMLHQIALDLLNDIMNGC